MGLELVMLAVCRWFRGGLWAGGRCHQLHEVLAPTGLRGTGHHSLLPTQQADLGRVGGRAGRWVLRWAWPGVGPPAGLLPRPPPTHRGGAVGALPAASALFILHGAELVMFRAGPRAPGAVGEKRC